MPKCHGALQRDHLGPRWWRRDGENIVKVLLTGEPGVGKTTLVQQALELLPGLRKAGFVTQELRGPLGRLGFALQPFGGERRILAHVDFVSRQRVGRYGVDLEIVNYVVDTSLRLQSDVDLYVVDEIGKMECLSRRFVAAMERLLNADVPLLATVALRGPGLIGAVKERSDVRLLEVTTGNRDALCDRIVELFGGGGTYREHVGGAAISR